MPTREFPDAMPDAQTSRLAFFMQVANSAFPTGAFNHSYGLETWIEHDRVRDAASLEDASREWLKWNLAPADGVAVALAYRATDDRDMARLERLDALVGALKLAREGREASYKTGQAMLTATEKIFEPKALEALSAAVKEGRCKGHHAVVFAVVGHIFGLSLRDTLTAFLHTGVANLVSVAARIIPIGQVETHRIIVDMWPDVIEARNVAMARDEATMATASAALDLASIQHERLYSRLCMS